MLLTDDQLGSQRCRYLSRAGRDFGECQSELNSEAISKAVSEEFSESISIPNSEQISKPNSDLISDSGPVFGHNEHNED